MFASQIGQGIKYSKFLDKILLALDLTQLYNLHMRHILIAKHRMI